MRWPELISSWSTRTYNSKIAFRYESGFLWDYCWVSMINAFDPLRL
ncbi:hypothetical protein Hanom_Chr12g01176951 [Helianthus anomalus]